MQRTGLYFWISLACLLSVIFVWLYIKSSVNKAFCSKSPDSIGFYHIILSISQYCNKAVIVWLLPSLVSWWLRCCSHTERFLLCMQSTRPAAVICLEAAVRTEKKQKKQKNKKTKQRQTVKFNIKKTNIFFQWNTYLVFCQRTCIRSLSLISLTSRGWYSSINSLGILLLALCSMCAPIGMLLSRHSKSLSRRNKAAGYLNVTGSWVSHEGYTIRLLSSQTSVVRG